MNEDTHSDELTDKLSRSQLSPSLKGMLASFSELFWFSALEASLLTVSGACSHSRQLLCSCDKSNVSTLSWLIWQWVWWQLKESKESEHWTYIHHVARNVTSPSPLDDNYFPRPLEDT